MKLHEGLTEAVAHDYEIALIAALGRYPDGPLANRTCGGEGLSGLRHTPETLAKLSVASRGRVISAETLAKMSKAQIGKPWSEKRRAKTPLRLSPLPKARKTMPMDTRVTKSVRLVPERWQIVFDLQEARGLSSMGAAVDVIVDWWEATKPMRQRIAERELEKKNERG